MKMSLAAKISISVMLSSCTIDKKLKIHTKLENKLKIVKKIENELEIDKAFFQ